MGHERRRSGLLFLLVGAMALALLCAEVGPVSAQTGGGYKLTWWTVDGGGDRLTGGGYVLVGTLGQPDAGTAPTGGGYRLTGGFWSGDAARYKVYLPLSLKNG